MQIWKFAGVAALSGLVATAGLADCPQAMDAAKGIVLTRSGDSRLVSHFRSSDGTLTEERVTHQGVEVREVTWTYFHALAPGLSKSANRVMSFKYDTPTSTLDDLAKLKVWKSTVHISANGQLLAEGHVTKTFLGKEKVKVGKCRYEAWAVDDRLVLGQDDSTYRQFYVPTLGVVVASFLLGPDGQTVSGVQYDKIAVGDK
jgi:hypothetical protein